ncbi:MAG TPA: hypothetical protein VKU01_08075 [Bryobacteraceae bacterium]|nr:hypothetical protein [Bryobacteraceae bacterium]
MGQERNCSVETRGRTYQGKALLETSEIIFRGEVRLKIPFQGMTRVETRDGKLCVDFGNESAIFHIGDAAEKWASKILNPPSRLDKLGIKDGTRIRWIGPVDEDFKREIEKCGAKIARAAPDLTFLRAESKADLDRVGELTAGPVWVIYPKGVKIIREQDVIDAGRAVGLTDIKVASFSTTHTGLKFVPRVAKAAK